MHERDTTSDAALQPENEDAGVGQERQVAEQGREQRLARLLPSSEDIPVAVISNSLCMPRLNGSPVDNVAYRAERAKRHERDIDRERLQLDAWFQVEGGVEPLSGLDSIVAGKERDERLAPEGLAEGVQSSDQVDDAYHEDALDRSGERGEVERAGVVLLPPVVSAQSGDPLQPPTSRRRSYTGTRPAKRPSTTSG